MFVIARLVKDSSFGVLGLKSLGENKKRSTLCLASLERSEKQVLLQSILSCVEVVVAPAQPIERLMCTTFQNEPPFEYQDLIRSADR